MGIAGSPEFFQSKMSELMSALEFVRTYLDDLLVIAKASLEDHVEKLRMVLTKLREAGLRINVDKSTFCTITKEYLGYTLTREGIKPHNNKVQAFSICRWKNTLRLKSRHILALSLGETKKVKLH